MNILKATNAGFRNYFQLSGRASRSEFWWFALALLSVTIPLLWIASAAETMLFENANRFVNNYHPVIWTAVAIVAIPLHTCGCRRLRDIGWPTILTFIPLLIVALTFIGSRIISGAPSSPGYNGYASWNYAFVMFSGFFVSVGGLAVAYVLPTRSSSNPNEVPQ